MKPLLRCSTTIFLFAAILREFATSGKIRMAESNHPPLLWKKKFSQPFVSLGHQLLFNYLVPRNGTLLNIQGLLRFKFHLEWMTSLMLYVPSFCVSTLQSTQFMSIPFRGPAVQIWHPNFLQIKIKNENHENLKTENQNKHCNLSFLDVGNFKLWREKPHFDAEH